jgi:hypothetical protein
MAPPSQELEPPINPERFKLTDLLATIANCPKARSVSIHDRCKPAKDQGDNSNLERHPASLSR